MATEGIPRVRICGWNPGTKDHDKVYIVRDATGVPLCMDVMLRDAQFIAACINACADTEAAMIGVYKKGVQY